MKRILIVLLLIFCQRQITFSQSTKTQILWDNYGVPHIYAKTTAGMYYAFGWAQMHNHANLLLQLYGLARGRGAEYWSGQWLSDDEIEQRFDVMGRAEKLYKEQKPEYKAYLDAFVKGINDYAKAHPENIGADYKQVLPITSQDVMAHMLHVLYIAFVAGDNIYTSKREVRGSNALAIAATRSASHHAMLMANPHLPWFNGIYTFFEAHLNGPGFDAYGSTLAGFPVLAIAFNKNLGWSHTVNTMDASTRYELKLKDNGYLLDGAVVPFESHTVTLKIKQQDGTMKEEQLVCKTSRQGPVVAEKATKPSLYGSRAWTMPVLLSNTTKCAKQTILGNLNRLKKCCRCRCSIPFMPIRRVMCFTLTAAISQIKAKAILVFGTERLMARSQSISGQRLYLLKSFPRFSILHRASYKMLTTCPGPVPGRWRWITKNTRPLLRPARIGCRALTGTNVQCTWLLNIKAYRLTNWWALS